MLLSRDYVGYMAGEVVKWGKVVHEAHIKPD